MKVRNGKMRKIKKIFCLLLCFVLIMSVVPAVANAGDIDLNYS